MKNVAIETTKDNKLVITIDLAKSCGPSKSGKTTIVGTSEGNQPITQIGGKTLVLGLNAYLK